jgi:hypothetical protein
LIIINRNDDDEVLEESLLKEDKLELHFATIDERDHWRKLIDDWTSSGLSSDASTMLECETAEGCLRELEKRVDVFDDLNKSKKESNLELKEKYLALIQRCEEWLHHTRVQRKYASIWVNKENFSGDEEEEKRARKKFKRRVMMEQAKRDELEEHLTKNTWCLSKIVFDTISSTYQHKLEPPIRVRVVTLMQVFMYIYIVLCSIWLMMFSVCNGSDKSWDWLVSNFVLVMTSATFVRPASLLGVNVLAPAFCLKFGIYCCGTNDKGKVEKSPKSKGETRLHSTSKRSTISSKKSKSKGHGVVHANSFAGDVDFGDIQMFHLNTKSVAGGDVAVAITSGEDDQHDVSDIASSGENSSDMRTFSTKE